MFNPHLLSSVLLAPVTVVAFLIPQPHQSVRHPPSFFGIQHHPSATFPSILKAKALYSSSLNFDGFDNEQGVSVGDTVSVIYQATSTDQERRLEEEDATVSSLSLVYGYNGWDGSEKPLVTPLVPRGDGSYVANVHVPLFAKVLDCAVSLDEAGLKWDTNGDQYYHLRITYIQEERDGVVYTLRQHEDGSLESLGVVEKNDPQELERMVEEALQARSSSGNVGGHQQLNKASQAAVLQEEELDDEEVVLVDKGQQLPPAVEEIEETNTVHRLRAEANVLGEKLGLGNVLINEVREVYGSYIKGDEEEGGQQLQKGQVRGRGRGKKMIMALEDVDRALAKLGFENLPQREIQGLIDRHHHASPRQQGGSSSEAEEAGISLEDFMHMYVELDDADTNIMIV